MQFINYYVLENMENDVIFILIKQNLFGKNLVNFQFI